MPRKGEERHARWEGCQESKGNMRSGEMSLLSRVFLVGFCFGRGKLVARVFFLRSVLFPCIHFVVTKVQFLCMYSLVVLHVIMGLFPAAR